MDQAVVYLFRVDPSSQGIGRSWSSYTDPQRGFKILTLAGLEMQIFVDPKDAKKFSIVPLVYTGEVYSGYKSKTRL
ncbi:MAG: hypothetical protein QF569_27405 [Candidatus Poribacteria bacterium]|nr:hypothetical protein [Candidatus Poribacteria bacterium]